MKGFLFMNARNFAIVQGMTLPREFRRQRVLLLGFGDIAKRLAHHQLSKATARHGPRLIAVSRSQAGVGCSVEHAIQKNRSVQLSWDLDQRAFANRLAHIGQMGIGFFPPNDAANPRIDSRARGLALALRRTHKRMPLVYISTTGVYGDHAGGLVSETTPCHPGQARSQRRLDAERILRPLGAHVLRVPGIYAHDRLPIARLKAQAPALRSEEDVFTNHIHAEDLAGIAWAALFHGRPARVTNTVDHTTLKMGDYFDLVAETLSLPKPPRVSMQEMKSLAQQGAISPMALSFYLESRQVRSGRLEQELRVQLSYPTVQQALKQYQSNSSRR